MLFRGDVLHLLRQGPITPYRIAAMLDCELEKVEELIEELKNTYPIIGEMYSGKLHYRLEEQAHMTFVFPIAY